MFYAHTKEGVPEEEWQPLEEHLKNVSRLAGEFAGKFGNKEMGELIGLAHDIGKYGKEFQERLKGSNKRVDHSSAGAKLMKQKYGDTIGLILANGILGHHGGLKNFYGVTGSGSSVQERLKQNVDDFQAYQSEISFPKQVSPFIKDLQKSQMNFSLSFYTRMLFSCLVDADFLDTERYINEEKTEKRSVNIPIPFLKEKFYAELEEMRKGKKITELNKIRNEILDDCINAAKQEPGMFTLTVPTGGGKTLSSAAFALKHAEEYGLERVIYVIPFTSIIEQNASVFRNFLDKEVVLEHHSNVDYSEIFDDENYNRSLQEERWRLASENWDFPFIVSTSVQFFESLFHHKTSKCRKLHNMAKSVIIIDEAQSIPVDYFRMCLEGLKELTRSYGSTVVLCTATQPYIDQFFLTEKKPVEIISRPSELYLLCKRTEVEYLSEISDDDICGRLLESDKALCIVNTKKHAHYIYQKLSRDSDEGIYHLSTHMYPEHRANILKEIRERLKTEERCIVVSTSLIEAGVDISFPYVYRSLTGIDSIAQAAGRCNREGDLKDEWGNRINGRVYVFESIEKHALPKGWMSYAASLGKEILQRYEDPLSLEAIEEYFKQLFSKDTTVLDRKKIFEDYNENELQYEFRELSERFSFIDSNTIPVIIPINDKVEGKVSELHYAKYPSLIVKELQKYIVNVYEYELKKLQESKSVLLVQDGLYILNDDSLYSEKEGLLVEEDSKYLNGFLNI
ncbi:CRISPR-associated helicase Cas3' [Robertmurraya andreesenii]|uniref:CRISPR-associated helicase Cas3/CRISPR-associated endonuclease Cas3-HD n=1 Tax=Anoxybacillus andreesenii TaxID=1325932 RepID=A0ABT9V9B2_9BACL|nr:CRISPR-associated helicase Cas3' [Robertmurraya andreesenii]MDQ0157554.1 CRISPR-associated helicase Cas3/CRISPR-associated endonuclease Cas3-HD [Robertmurraya andreesenii]